MSRDGRLPDNVSEADFDRAFPPDCPDDCVSMKEVYSECGGEGICICYDNRHPILRWFLRKRDIWKFGEEVCVPKAGDCDCAERKAAAKADAADRRMDEERDR